MDLSTGKRRRYDIESLIGDCEKTETRSEVTTQDNTTPQRHDKGALLLITVLHD